MTKKKKEYPDLSANPQNIKIGDWVTHRDKFGLVTARVKSGICEFWVQWSGHTVPTNQLASGYRVGQGSFLPFTP